MSRRYIGSLIDAFNTLKVANAPTIGTATGACAKVCVTFTAPSCVGGAAITSYSAISCATTGYKTGTGTISPIAVTCLTNGTSYTFRVLATNAFGPSVFSAGSASASAVASFGIFAIGNGGPPSYAALTTTNKYIFSSDSSSVSTSLTGTVCYGSAAGNSTRGIFALGGAVATRSKYIYSGCTTTSATSSNYRSSGGAAAGNSTIGIFATGSIYCPCACSYFTASNREKYTYSGDTNGSATSSSSNSNYGAAAGNSTLGIFGLGRVCGTSTTTRNKYTYASCTNGSATASSYTLYAGAATGNCSIAIFQLGNTNIRNKYTFSGDVNAVAAAVNTYVTAFAGHAAGNSTVGIFAIGCSNSVNYSTFRQKFTYSSCTSAATTASSRGSNGGAAASNGTTGVNV